MGRAAVVIGLMVALVGPMSPRVSAQRADTTQADGAKPESTRPFFTLTDAAIAGGFVVGTLAISQVDDELARTLQDPDLQESGVIQHGADFFGWMGQPFPEIAGVVLWGAGRVAHNRPVAALGLHGLEALLLSAAFTKGIKGSAGRARPFVHSDTIPDDWEFLRGFKEGRDYSSFPSGHTATAFSVAASTTAETIHWVEAKGWWPGWKYVTGITLFGGATLVGISRMYHDQHWASDVVGGAAIGTFSGLKVVKYAYRHPRNRLDRWLLPLTVVPGRNGSLILSWTMPARGGEERPF